MKFTLSYQVNNNLPTIIKSMIAETLYLRKNLIAECSSTSKGGYGQGSHRLRSRFALLCLQRDLVLARI
jgi:hypothetical protein